MDIAGVRSRDFEARRVKREAGEVAASDRATIPALPPQR